MNFEQTRWYGFLINVLGIAVTLGLAANAGFEPFKTFSGIAVFMLTLGAAESSIRAVIGLIVVLIRPHRSKRRGE